MDVPAYYEITRDGKEKYEGLKEHSLRTASVGLVLFEKELGDLKDEFVLAAMLHDVGKANVRSLKQYESLKRTRKLGKVSFKCHEVLSAQAVLKLKKYSLEFRRIYEPVFYAVLRHHHAMRKVTDCLEEDLILDDVGKLKELIPELSRLKGLRPINAIVDEAKRLERKKEGFVLAGFLSLADSVAAYLARRSDSTEKPNKFVRLALEERGWSPGQLDSAERCRRDEVAEVVRKYF